MEARSLIETIRDLAEREQSHWPARMALVKASGVPTMDGPTGGPTTIEEYEARQTEIRNRVREIDEEYAGQALPDERRTEWDSLNEELERNDELLDELIARRDRVAQVADEGSGGTRESGTSHRRGAARTSSRGGGDIWDVTQLRMLAPADQEQALRDNALRAVEISYFPHEHANREDVQSHVSRLIDRFAAMDEMESSVGLSGGNMVRFCRHLLVTGNPTYRRAFRRGIRGGQLTPDESRALSLAGASGGFAVPYQLDPTIIPTSNSSVNPYRSISRVEPITVDEWRGVSSAGVVATYASEAAQATDDSPTLGQPTVSTERCQTFIPYSFEVGQDWGSLESEMAVLIQDAKDDVEAAKFTLGSGTNEPFGLVTGATTIVTAGGSAAFAIADLYSTEQALGPRFRSRARWVGNRAIYNRARQFDTAGGSGVWLDGLQPGLANQVPTPGQIGPRLLGYPAHEVSAMDAVLTTGSEILVFGDFRYFIIVDRIGMSISQIPHLFGANQRPTGQSGLYAFWRNSSKVLDANAFRTLRTG
jgi:HK97 family phage major capsid protein